MKTIASGSTQTPVAAQVVTPRARTRLALSHRQPDRTPVDFLATPEVWDRLIAHLQPDVADLSDMTWLQPEREAVLRALEVDCRVVSYDMFCAPPDRVLQPGARVDVWGSLARSTPNCMWRQVLPDGTLVDIWGTRTRRVSRLIGEAEEWTDWPLAAAQTVNDLRAHPWPQPDWWDFAGLPAILARLDQSGEYHIRFRLGSLFEVAWQLRGLDRFLLDLAIDPDLPTYLLDRLSEVYEELLRRVLAVDGGRLDMIYFYDDVATQSSLMMSPAMWRQHIRPRHQRLAEIAHAAGKQVMYHCDGAIYPLIPELIDIGIDVLSPVQTDAEGMDPARLKREFGDRLAFHGGIDIMRTLPRGAPEEVRAEVRARVEVLGQDGGYILCSSHHIQPDTPVANVLAMYEPPLRVR
jgi:uroporphyrinogen decarboxylase